MRIRVVRSGGLAGLRRDRAVDTERLSDLQRVEVERLVIEARFFDLPARATSGLPDVILYRVRVEMASRAHEVTTDDRTAAEPLLTLAAWVLERGE